MSKGCQSISQTDRKIYRAPGRQTRVTERQNDSMTVWQIGGQLKSPLLFFYFPFITVRQDLTRPSEYLKLSAAVLFFKNCLPTKSPKMSFSSDLAHFESPSAKNYFISPRTFTKLSAVIGFDQNCLRDFILT